MKENILFIITDDQTINTINSQGNDQIITPNLDKLCQEGMIFDNCHIQGGTSGALCMPSRAMINTSKNMLNLTAAGNEIPKTDPLLGEFLKNNGYETFFTGKWHNGVDGFARSFTCGENIFFGGMWDHYNVPMNDFDPSGKYDNKVKYVVDFFNENKPIEMRANKFNHGVFSSDVITSSALKFINDYNEDKPFYMNVSYLAPHDPRVVSQKYIDLYKDIEVNVPDNFLDDHPFEFGQSCERDEQLATRPLDKKWCANEIKTYYAMITQLDEHLGQIICALKEKGIYDDTLIIFTSDNGISLSSHGLLGKQNLYEESIRVPFIIKGSKIKPQSKCSEFILLQDIFPTIVEYLGLDINAQLEGHSFYGQLMGQSIATRQEIYLIFTDLIRGIKTKQYKYIEYRNKENKQFFQLFDLLNDPKETKNVIELEEYAKPLTMMREKFNECRQQYDNEENNFSKEYWNRV